MRNYKIASNQQEWLEIRNAGIGGSDVGSILGFNQYKTPYQLWLEKTNQIELPDLSGKIAIQIGNELEDLVARLFSQETGLQVQKDNKTYFHKDYPFLLANIDRKIVGQKALLECKTTSQFNAKQWEDDEIPASYLLQVQHYLNVLDYDLAFIAVLIGNREFVWKEIKRDEQLIEQMNDQLGKFWNENVLKRIPPEIDGSSVTKAALNLVEVEGRNSLPILKNQKEELDQLREVKKQIQTLKDFQNEVENKIKHHMLMNEAEELVSTDYQVTWKTTERTTIDSKTLKKELPDVYEKYSKTTASKRFTVKELD